MKKIRIKINKHNNSLKKKRNLLQLGGTLSYIEEEVIKKKIFSCCKN